MPGIFDLPYLANSEASIRAINFFFENPNFSPIWTKTTYYFALHYFYLFFAAIYRLSFLPLNQFFSLRAEIITCLFLSPLYRLQCWLSILSLSVNEWGNCGGRSKKKKSNQFKVGLLYLASYLKCFPKWSALLRVGNKKWFCVPFISCGHLHPWVKQVC